MEPMAGNGTRPTATVYSTMLCCAPCHFGASNILEKLAQFDPDRFRNASQAKSADIHFPRARNSASGSRRCDLK